MIDEREYESLDPKEQERIFREAPLRDRGILLTHAQHPDKLVRLLTQEELYLLTREVDADEKCEIVKYANLPQLFFISDIDCWKRDQIDPTSFVQWLETLLSAGGTKVTSWMLKMDYEMVIAALRKVMVVLKPDKEYAIDEILGDRPYFTLDEYYYIHVREEDLESVKRVIHIIYEQFRGKYAALMEGILGEVTDELEEEAFRRRSVRLAERGFPDPASAFQIYRAISQEEFEAFPLKAPGAKRKKDKEADLQNQKAPLYPSLFDPTKSFLDDVLMVLRHEDAEAAEGLQEEMAWLSNKVIACSGLDFSSENKVREGVHRARGFVNIGLELLSEGKVERAKELVRDRWLETIFRWGVSHLYSTRARITSLIDRHWDKSHLDFLNFLDQPYESILQGFIRKNIPQKYDGISEDGRPLFIDFNCAAVIRTAEISISQIELLHEVLQKYFDFKTLQGTDVSAGQLLFWMLLTEERKKNNISQPDSERIKNFTEEHWDAVTKTVQMSAEIKEAYLDSFLNDEQKTVLKTYMAILFDRIAAELSELKLGKRKAEQLLSSYQETAEL